MHAVVTAGSKPSPGDPLYEFTRGQYKALLEIAGKPMIQWILDAVSATGEVESVVVVGLPPFTDLHCSKPIVILEDQGNLLANNRAGIQEILRFDPGAEHALLLTSDVPAITAEMIEWVAAQITRSSHEFVYPVIPRQVMEKRFPGSRRTYLHLKDMEVCGGDIMAIRAGLANQENPFWQKVIDARKNPLRQASILGLDTLFLILLRQMTLAEASRAIGKRMGMDAVAVPCPFAEIGMDVDKPHQFQLMQTELSR